MVSSRDVPLSDVNDVLPPGVDPAVVLSLVATYPKDGTNHPSGSAIAISDHFALTAKHVVDDYIAKEAERGGAMVRAASALSEDHKQREWSIRASVTDAATEIALLYFGESGAPIKGLDFPVLEIAPPATGTKAIAIGFAESTAEPLHGDAWEWRERPNISRGRITEVHLGGRDGVLMPYPSFATNNLVKGGMSGGPVFSEDGRVLGIVSSGIEDEAAPYATISLIWTALGLPLSKLKLPEDGRDYLLDLAVRAEIRCSNLKCLDSEYRESLDGPKLRLTLHTRAALPPGRS